MIKQTSGIPFFNEFDMNTIVIDLDNTITIESDAPYQEKKPNLEVVEKIRVYKSKGFKITINTSRNMRTYNGNLGKINVHTLPIIIDWLNKYKIPYDEIYLGKPWCGHNGFYVDDKAIRPSEFASMSFEKINELLDNEVNVRNP